MSIKLIDVKLQKQKKMDNSNSGPSFGKKLFIVTGIILSIVFIMLKLQGHIDWSWWLVFSPILAIVALYVIKLIIGMLCILGISIWSNDMKKQLRTICNDIVHIIQETNEGNVQECAKQLHEKMKWINDHKKTISSATPSSTKRLSFMIRNSQHEAIARGIANGELSAKDKKSAVIKLKSFETDYATLWF